MDLTRSSLLCRLVLLLLLLLQRENLIWFPYTLFLCFFCCSYPSGGSTPKRRCRLIIRSPPVMLWGRFQRSNQTTLILLLLRVLFTFFKGKVSPCYFLYLLSWVSHFLMSRNSIQARPSTVFTVPCRFWTVFVTTAQVDQSQVSGNIKDRIHPWNKYFMKIFCLTFVNLPRRWGSM